MSTTDVTEPAAPPSLPAVSGLLTCALSVASAVPFEPVDWLAVSARHMWFFGFWFVLPGWYIADPRFGLRCVDWLLGYRAAWTAVLLVLHMMSVRPEPVGISLDLATLATFLVARRGLRRWVDRPGA